MFIISIIKNHSSDIFIQFFRWTGFVTLSDKKQHVIPACFLAGIQEITKTAIQVKWKGSSLFLAHFTSNKSNISENLSMISILMQMLSRADLTPFFYPEGIVYYSRFPFREIN